MTCIRDYVHVTDLVDAHLAVLGHVANPPVLYNVGTGKGVTVREFVDACKRVTGVDVTVREQLRASLLYALSRGPPETDPMEGEPAVSPTPSCPWLFLPQHESELSERIPQESFHR